MYIKISDPDLQTIWVNTDLIVAVVIPSPLSKSVQCQIIAQGVVVPVSHAEASRVAHLLNGNVL